MEKLITKKNTFDIPKNQDYDTIKESDEKYLFDKSYALISNY